MKTKPSTARDVFLYLLVTITLAISTISLLTLLFQYINISFPDPLDWYSGVTSTARGAMAALIVAWPTLLLLSRTTNKELVEKTEKKDIWVRRWLLYLALFVASIAILVDLIVLLNGFLGGELTTRVGLKVLSVTGVAAVVFWYYNWELKRDPKEESKIPQITAAASSVFVVGWIIAGFFIIGTPAEQRDIRMDEERISDLQEISYAIDLHYSDEESLPEDLSSIKDRYFSINDPETNAPYEYRVIDENSYELCATFERGRINNEMRQRWEAGSEWDYTEGRNCFERDAEDIYKPLPITE